MASSVSWWTPINEAWFDNYFHISGPKGRTITSFSNNDSSHPVFPKFGGGIRSLPVELYDDDTSKGTAHLLTVLKIISYFTIFIPLIILSVKYCERSNSHFHVWSKEMEIVQPGPFLTNPLRLHCLIPLP